MKKIKKKMLLMCSIALILSGLICFSSCSVAEGAVTYIVGWASYSFVIGWLDGAKYAVVDASAENGNLQVIEDDWNGFWKSVGDGISNGWNTLVNGATELWTGITSIF